MSKLAIIVFAGAESHADLGRMTNALEILGEFTEAGDEATLLFDGAGVSWPGKMNDEDHPLHKAFKKAKPNILGACKYCSNAFKAVDDVKEAGITLLDDYNGHPSVRDLVKKGYQVITV